MKKKIIIFGSIAAVLVVAGIILMVALLKPNEQPPAGEDPTVELAVPRGVTLNGTVLSWDAVENATEYIVYVNDKEYTTNDCSFDLDGKANERDKIKVVAKAEGYLNSKSSIEKIYITVVDHKEVTSMATNLSNYISNIGYDDKTLEQIAPAIENVCVALFKEGLVAQDIENIVTTLDSVVNNLEELDVETPQELLEVVTTEVNKLVDLNIPSYALTVALKEVASFVVDIALEEVNVEKQNMCLVVGMPSYGMTQEEVIELLVNLNDYLDNIKNRDLEKIAMVIDTFKNIYVAFNKEIPTIVAELEKLYTTTNGEASFEAVYSVVENLVKVKDSVLNAILSSMPTMEEFTEVVSLFESLYENLAPEYLVENNPYDLYIYLWQEYYSNVHLLLSFYKEIDAEMLLELKPYITNIYTIFENEYNDFMDYVLGNDNMTAPLGLIQYVLSQTGLTEDEINDLVFGIMSLVEDVTENPEDFINKLLKEFYKAFEEFDYSIITEDPLVQKIMTIVLSENPEVALEDFLENDLKIDKYISYKDGKTMDDLLNALMNVSLEEVINFLASGEEFTSSKVVEVLGIEDIVTLKVEDLFKALFKLADVETLELVNAVLRVENISDIETILAKYFKVEVKFDELLTSTLNSILAEYNLDLEYKGLIDNFIKNLSLDKLYTEFGNVYNVIVKNVTEFNTNYVPLVPTKDPASTEVLLDYIYKNAIYNIFGNESAAAVTDLKAIYESLVSLKEHDEIKEVLENVFELFKDYDYSFDFEAYINDEVYLKAFNKKLTDLLNNLLNETDNAYNWVLGFEEDLESIAKALDNFTTKYFGGSFDIYETVNELFEMLDMYAINDDMKEIYQDTIKDLVENVLRGILEDVYEFGGKAGNLYNDIYQVLEGNILDIIEIITNFDKTIDFDSYLENDEYRSEFNQNLLELCNDLIDQYVLLHKDALTTEEFFNEFALYVDELCDKYFNDNMDLEYLVVELFDYLEYYQLSEEDVDLAKEYLETFIKDFDEKFPLIFEEVKLLIENATVLGNDIYQDYLINQGRILELYKIINGYIKEYGSIEYVYEFAEEELTEFVNLIDVILSPNDLDNFDKINENIHNIYELLGLEYDYDLVYLYQLIDEYLEVVLKGFDISKPVTIEHWYANGSALTIVLEQIKYEFEEKYPNITVELINCYSYTFLRDSIAEAIEIGNAPTTAQTYPEHAALYLQGNALVALDKYINDPEYGMSEKEQQEFVEGFWNEGTIYDEAGTRYAMPFNKSTELMFYNKDMFDKYGWDVPQTWDEVIAICEAWKNTPEYKEAVHNYGASQVFGLGYDSEANLFITLTQQYGATYTSFDANGKGVFNAFGAVDEDMLKSKDAMNWYYEEFEKGNVATCTAFGTDYCSDAFLNGQCIMVIGSSAGATYNDGQNAWFNEFETGVAAVPQKDLSNGQVIQQGTNVSLFKCDTKIEELAGWLWLKHMVSYESALTWALNTAYFPIRKDVINSFEYQNHIQGNLILDNGTVVFGTQSLTVKAKQAGILQADWFFTNVVFNGSSRARDEAESLVQNLLYGYETLDTLYADAYNKLK